MSSSEFLQRPELVDLLKGTPPARGVAFTEQAEFDRIDRSPMFDTTPEEAHREGLAEGERRGREQALKELEPVVEELRSCALALADVRRQRLTELEGELVEIARQIAQRILRGELHQDGDTVLHMAHACLMEAAEPGAQVLRVSPGDLELVRTHAAELEAELCDATVVIQADAAVAPGCAILETATRVFDGRPERMLEAASRALAEREQEEGA